MAPQDSSLWGQEEFTRYKIHLDFTRNRLKLIDRANDMLKQIKEENSFAFEDVNCCKCLNMDDRYHYFESEQDLLQILYPENADKDEELSKVSE